MFLKENPDTKNWGIECKIEFENLQQSKDKQVLWDLMLLGKKIVIIADNQLILFRRKFELLYTEEAIEHSSL